MARITVLVVLAGLVSVATCFTTTTTSNSCSSNNNKRKQDLNVCYRKSFHIQKQPVAVSFPISTTLLFEGKESSSSSTATTTDSTTMLDGVVELGSESTTVKETSNDTPSFMEQAVAPFLSQGEIDPQTLNPDLSDPKQARVIIYIILSLVPVLFLIPLMIGSRDLIPLDAVAPVQL